MGRRKMTTAEFINRCKSIHGDMYDYTGTRFDRSDKPITILCKTHGAFTQLASNHLRGMGCKPCSTDAQRLGANNFVEKAKLVHGNIYDYSKIQYVNGSTKVEIICEKHGPFMQRPSKHLDGTGCPKCQHKYVTTEEFIEKAKKVHGERYDYSKVVYKPGYTKIEIVCPSHGSFFQVTYNHLSNKQGCPSCKHEKNRENIGMYGPHLFEAYPDQKETPAYFYRLRCYDDHEEFYKVGITTQSQPRKRWHGIPYNIEVLMLEKTTLYHAWMEEQTILSLEQKYIPRKYFHGWTECFKKQQGG